MLVDAAPALRDSTLLCSAESNVAREAQRRLEESPYFALRTLRCDYHEGILTVRGQVPSFYTRQVALQTLRGVRAVEQLVDRIEVE